MVQHNFAAVGKSPLDQIPEEGVVLLQAFRHGLTTKMGSNQT